MDSGKIGGTRTAIKYRGDLGELKVVKEFLELGCAVNSLTSADYALDLHIQIPEAAQLKPAGDWQLSGLTAHVQVKSSEKDSAPKVKDWQLRSWAAGTAVGTPTFVFFVDAVSDKTYVSTPWHLQRRLDDLNGAREPSLGDGYRMVYDPELFQHLLQLWCRYASLMLLLGLEGIPARIAALEEDEKQEGGLRVASWRDSLADQVGMVVHATIWDRESAAKLSSDHVDEVQSTTTMIAREIGLEDPEGFGKLAAEWLTDAIQPRPLVLEPWQLPQPYFRRAFSLFDRVNIAGIARHLGPCLRIMLKAYADPESPAG